MEIHEYVTRENVVLTGGFTDKNELLEYLCRNISHVSGRDLSEIRDSVVEREAKISTGIGMGIAVPHGRIKGWGETTMSFLLMEEPLEYESLDGKPVRFVIMFISDYDRPCEHVNILSKISFVLAEGDTLIKILDCQSAEELYNTILATENIL